MSFINTQYLSISLLVFAAITVILYRLNSRFFNWVKTYWFYDRTWMSRISSFLYLMSLLLFMLSLLDLRGPEKKVRASLPDQRTIILLDTSSSMLAEDVRPSRFVKSLQLARHFVKNAAGHQVSIVLFSDIQKRLVPFTDDIDLLDSRLAALEKTNSVSGGSNISQALEEAIQYFEFDSNNEDKSHSGNMLVFTDAEESEGEFKVNVPKNVNLAIVGVGTLKGANIPLRWENGEFRGYKTFKGQPVVTKLDEDYIRKIGKGVSSFKYWVANSYSLPTDEIMNFFRATYNKKNSTGDMRIRPVYSHYILIPAILLYGLSVLLGRFPLFKMIKTFVVLLAIGFSVVGPGYAQDEQSKEKPLSPEIKKDLEIIREGNADRKYVLKVAEKLLREKNEKQATELYSEYSKKNDDEEIRFNYATSLLKSNRLTEALPIVQDLLSNSKSETLKNKLRNNLLLGTDPNKQKEQNKENQKQKQEQQNNKENQDNKDNKNQQDQQKKENKKDSGKSEKEDKNKDNKQNGKQEDSQKKPEDNGKTDDKEKTKKNDKNKDQGKKEEEKEEDQKQQKSPQSLEEKEKQIEQKRRMTKTPGVIKQILSDDRELQKKMMDTSTNERGEMKPKRDW